MQNNQTSSMLMHMIRGRKLKGHIAFSRQLNRPPRRITEKSLAESFPAECWSWTAELSNGRLPFSRIFIFADLEKSNQILFDSLFFRAFVFVAPLRFPRNLFLFPLPPELSFIVRYRATQTQRKQTAAKATVVNKEIWFFSQNFSKAYRSITL